MKVGKKITELERQIGKLTAELAPMEQDERHPASRHFPSQASKDGTVTDLRGQLENAQNDLAILRMVASGELQFRDKSFYKKTADDFRQCKENLQKGEIELRAKLAMLDRARILLR